MEVFVNSHLASLHTLDPTFLSPRRAPARPPLNPRPHPTDNPTDMTHTNPTTSGSHGLAARAAAIGTALAYFPGGGACACTQASATTASLARWRTAFDQLVRDVGPFLEAGGGGGGGEGDRLVVAISDVAASLRALESGHGPCASMPASSATFTADAAASPTTFIRQSQKFFVAPGREAEVKLALATRLPVSLVGARVRGSPPPGWTPAVTSVYLDTPAFGVHAARSARLDGASLTRLRWYGDGHAAGAVFVETKTHREPGDPAAGPSTPSSKDRVRVSGAAAAAALLDPSATIPHGLAPLVDAVASGVRSTTEPLRPVIATLCRRLAFESKKVRVTLDEGLSFVGGAEGDATAAAVPLRDWVAGGGVGPPAGTSSEPFPFSVLEIKTQYKECGTPAPPPAWLAALISDPSIVASGVRFSKYLCAASTLYPAAGLASVGWVGLGNGGDSASSVGPPQAAGVSATTPTALRPARKAAAAVEGAGEAEKPKPPLRTRSFQSLSSWRRSRRLAITRRGLQAAGNASTPLLPLTASAGPPPPPAWPPRRATEPKVFFSNERTFLAWLQVAVLLLLLGVSLLSGGKGGGTAEVVLGGVLGVGAQHGATRPASQAVAKTYLVAGGAVANASVLFMAYAFIVFRRRAARLGGGGGGGGDGFSDARGAAVLAALALLAGVATLVAAFARVGLGV